MMFLQLLKKFTERGENISPAKKANSYAPTRFVEAPEAKLAGLRKRDFESAMERLLEAGRVKIEEYGYASRRASRLIVA